MSKEQLFSLHPDTDEASKAADRLFAGTVLILRKNLLAAADIRHVGATAITGCLTKGDLDIAVRVEPQDFEQADQTLSRMFDRNSGSIRTRYFSAFEDAMASPQLGIQLVAKGDSHDFFHLFVDELKREPSLVREYNALKGRFVGMPMSDYRIAKDRFIAKVLKHLPTTEDTY